MNLFLLEEAAVGDTWAPDDPRSVHLRTVLGKGPGDDFDIGVRDGPRGRAHIERIDDHGLHLRFRWERRVVQPRPCTVLVGLPRPQTARRILYESACLGVRELRFIRTDRSERSYAHSRLWTTGEWERRLVEGAEQAFATDLPQVSHAASLEDALAQEESHPDRMADRYGLDNYEAAVALPDAPATAAECVLALGGERGWSDRERNLLRNSGYRLCHLGPRVLRTETALVAAFAIEAARRRWMDPGEAGNTPSTRGCPTQPAS